VEVKKRTKEEVDEQDAVFDFVDFRAGVDRLGWLVTYSAITVSDPETGAELSGEEKRTNSPPSAAALLSNTIILDFHHALTTARITAGIEYYFIQQDGHKFKALLKYFSFSS
jgi:hypothetical protein